MLPQVKQKHVDSFIESIVHMAHITYKDTTNVIIKFIPKFLMMYIIVTIAYYIAEFYRRKIIDRIFKLDNTNIPIAEQLLMKNKYKNTDDIHSNHLIFYQLSNIIYYVIISIGIIISIMNFGIHTSTILTIIGTSGLAIGLSLQNTLASIAAGIYISLNDIFKIGDIINIGGFTGKVKGLTLFTTLLVNENGEINIPNSMIQNSAIVNLSR